MVARSPSTHRAWSSTTMACSTSHLEQRPGEARFGRHAQTELGAYLADDEPPRLLVGGKAYTIGVRKLAANSELQAET
jgi:hypothetical protein